MTEPESELKRGLPELGVRRPWLVLVMNLLIAICGMAALMAIEVRELPDVDRPVVSVNAFLPGASPETMDAEVTAGCTGIVLAKLDGSARGGVIVPVVERFGLPVKFVGLGEAADDLEPFDPDAFVSALLEGALAP